MVLHGEETLKTTKQKNLTKSQKFAKRISATEFRYIQFNYFAVDSNLKYDCEAYDLRKLYFETSHAKSGRTPAVELLCGNSQRVKTVGSQESYMVDIWQDSKCNTAQV